MLNYLRKGFPATPTSRLPCLRPQVSLLDLRQSAQALTLSDTCSTLNLGSQSSLLRHAQSLLTMKQSADHKFQELARTDSARNKSSTLSRVFLTCLLVRNVSCNYLTQCWAAVSIKWALLRLFVNTNQFNFLSYTVVTRKLAVWWGGKADEGKLPFGCGLIAGRPTSQVVSGLASVTYPRVAVTACRWKHGMAHHLCKYVQNWTPLS